MTYRDDLTGKQQDYSIFLPALSGFYSGYIGKQRSSEHVEKSRIPSDFESGIEGLNFLNPDQGYFTYKWALYSAGHANLDVTQTDASEDMIRNRHPDSFLLGDSGGFQIGKGVWEGDWRAGSGCAQAQKRRRQVLDWMESYMNYGMGLDVPGWVSRTPRGREKTGITSYAEALEATKYNFEYWMKNRQGRCKFLTVLQGDTHTQADEWYDEIKKYSDPRVYPNDHFNGWAMGSQNKCDAHLVLKRLVALIYDGLLESGKQDWVHYLGTSKLEWAMMFTDIQRAIRKYHNPTLTISYDCASPFLATANGQVYWQNRLEDRDKWSYQMKKCLDDKKYASDNRWFRDAIVQDKHKEFPEFISSPIIDRIKISDICWYAPGDLNKIGKEGRTSWDSFSYALLMGHNVYAHILAVQEGNRRYDQGIIPGVLIQENFDLRIFRDIVDDIFAAKTRARADQLVDECGRWCESIVGSSANGMLGKKATNARTQFDKVMESEGSLSVKLEKNKKKIFIPVLNSSLFESEDSSIISRDDSGFDEEKLNQLEQLPET
jgi:hypothetical protein